MFSRDQIKKEHILFVKKITIQKEAGRVEKKTNQSNMVRKLRSTYRGFGQE